MVGRGDMASGNSTLMMMMMMISVLEIGEKVSRNRKNYKNGLPFLETFGSRNRRKIV